MEEHSFVALIGQAQLTGENTRILEKKVEQKLQRLGSFSDLIQFIRKGNEAFEEGAGLRVTQPFKISVSGSPCLLISLNLHFHSLKPICYLH